VLVRAYADRVLDAERVAALRAEGHSLRAIAAALGASLGAVQRALKRRDRLDRLADDGDDLDDLDDERAAVFDPEPVLVEPFTFCGVEIEIVQHRGEDPRVQESERWLDANGRSVSELDIWRYWTHRAGDHGDYETGERVCADMARQRAEWGLTSP